MGEGRKQSEKVTAPNTTGELVENAPVVQPPAVIQPAKDKPKKLSEAIDETSLSDEETLNTVLSMAEGADVAGMEDAAADADYYKPTEGDQLNIVVTGIGEYKIDDKPVECIQFKDKNGKRFIAGAAMLVNTIKRLAPFPVVVRIVVGAKVSGANGKYFTFQIYKL